jgi:predicted ester cyclase
MDSEEVVIEGSRAVQIVRMTGRHDGDFLGIAPTGRHVEAQMASLMTIADGLITEERRIFDFTGVLLQVGVLKAKPA